MLTGSSFFPDTISNYRAGWMHCEPLGNHFFFCQGLPYLPQKKIFLPILRLSFFDMHQVHAHSKKSFEVEVDSLIRKMAASTPEVRTITTRD